MPHDSPHIPDDGRRPIRCKRVLEALASVPRVAFVPEDQRDRWADDGPLPIGHSQTISQPYIVGIMLELLAVTGGVGGAGGSNVSGGRVLEIGAGSGYQAALLAHLGCEVHTVEIIRSLADRCAETLAGLGVDRVRVHHADGFMGWPAAAPFDGIVIACACDEVPPSLWSQLSPGGRIVAPVRNDRGSEDLVVVCKGFDDSRSESIIMPVRFVPLTRELKS